MLIHISMHAKKSDFVSTILLFYAFCDIVMCVCALCATHVMCMHNATVSICNTLHLHGKTANGTNIPADSIDSMQISYWSSCQSIPNNIIHSIFSPLPFNCVLCQSRIQTIRAEQWIGGGRGGGGGIVYMEASQ